jgi:hypothetical protein
MTDIATKFNLEQPKFKLEQPMAVHAARLWERTGLIRYLLALTLIAVGGVATVVWAAFLGWAAGKLFQFW